MRRKDEALHVAIFYVGRLLDTEGIVNTRRVMDMTGLEKCRAKFYIQRYRKLVEPLEMARYHHLKQGWVRKQQNFTNTQ